MKMSLITVLNKSFNHIRLIKTLKVNKVLGNLLHYFEYVVKILVAL